MTRRYTSGTRWCAWRWTDVILGGLLYLRRLHLVQTPWFAVMLHWIERPDPQPDMHDHPVSFLSIPLRGWYVEEIPCDCQARLACAIAYGGTHARTHCAAASKRAADCHRIIEVSPGGCLTLVFAGPVVRRWGFHTAAGWIPWREYTK